MLLLSHHSLPWMRSLALPSPSLPRRVGNTTYFSSKEFVPVGKKAGFLELQPPNKFIIPPELSPQPGLTLPWPRLPLFTDQRPLLHLTGCSSLRMFSSPSAYQQSIASILAAFLNSDRSCLRKGSLGLTVGRQAVLWGPSVRLLIT